MARGELVTGDSPTLRTAATRFLAGAEDAQDKPGQLETLVAKWQANGMAVNTVRNAFMPLQAIYRWAVKMELASFDQTERSRLLTGTRDTPGSPKPQREVRLLGPPLRR